MPFGHGGRPRCSLIICSTLKTDRANAAFSMYILGSGKAKRFSFSIYPLYERTIDAPQQLQHKELCDHLASLPHCMLAQPLGMTAFLDWSR